MKKKESQFEFIVLICIFGFILIFNIVGIILYAKNSYNYTYSQKKSFEYSIDANNVTIFGSNKDKELTYLDGYGPKTAKLNYGSNNLELKIKNKLNEFDTYSLAINKEDNRDSENRLSNIIISNTKIDFEEDKETYNLSVGNIDKISINAFLKSDKAKFDIDYGPRIVSLNSGLNVVILKVKAQSGDERYYKLNIFKNDNVKSDINNDNLLKSLNVNNQKITLNKDQFDYEVTVSGDNQKANIYAFTDNPNDKITIGDNVLANDENNITINVNDKNTYNIKVIKESIKPKENNTLEYLAVGGYNLHFDKNKFNYEIVSQNNYNLIISAYSNSDNVTIVEEKEKSVNYIKVLLSNNNEILNTYTIKVKSSFWNIKNEIFAVLFTFIVGFGILMIIKRFELKKKEQIALEKQRQKNEAKKKKASQTKKTSTKKNGKKKSSSKKKTKGRKKNK